MRQLRFLEISRRTQPGTGGGMRACRPTVRRNIAVHPVGRTAARTRNARPYENTGGVGVGADAHIRPAALGRFAARVDGDIDPYNKLEYPSR